MRDTPPIPDIVFGSAADALGRHADGPVNPPRESDLFPSGSAAGGSERVDYGIPAPQCQGPQAGSPNFNSNSIAPDATPPETYQAILDRNNFHG